MSDQFVIGLDFGTLSGRAAVVRVSDGKRLIPIGGVGVGV
ncbi:Hypothetical protein PFR_JS23_114 [Propionibacterium freudenreichii]|uniref:Ribulokinase n=1 Tax=Propionibacterium freudenreichii TaxID=1744 RepID=A0A509ME71_9ACTN|nr:Hypothetical protein PFR_JS23_114 [Propionibacterium freudenreichii]